MMGIAHIPWHREPWAEAVQVENCFRIRLYISAGNGEDKTPYERFMKKMPSFSHLKVFGSKSFVHILKIRRPANFDSRAEIGFYVGYTSGKSYGIYLPSRSVIIASRAIFFKNQYLQRMQQKCRIMYLTSRKRRLKSLGHNHNLYCTLRVNDHL